MSNIRTFAIAGVVVAAAYGIYTVFKNIAHKNHEQQSCNESLAEASEDRLVAIDDIGRLTVKYIATTSDVELDEIRQLLHGALLKYHLATARIYFNNPSKTLTAAIIQSVDEQLSMLDESTGLLADLPPEVRSAFRDVLVEQKNSIAHC